MARRGSPACRALNCPAIRATRPAAAAKENASTANGRKNAPAISTLPSGGPTNVLATCSADHIRPLATSSCSGSTIAGMIVCAELSRSTSANPSSRLDTTRITYSPVRVPTTSSMCAASGRSWPMPSTTMATNAVSTARRQSIATIALRRSTRSVITPAGSVNTSHGSRWATATTATRIGLRVTAEASHG